ncbi:hypothetical protein Abr02nite_55920 [Paractinoplanes brasiliensis]|nr:hypothetical protein Abr02nite_55920 [Actinoplanes brasiliensis]
MVTALDVVMWPDCPWAGLRAEWQRADRIGIGRGWLWDHLTLGDRPVWHEAYAVLAAAAAVTDRIGVGTMVTAPNFRHPVTAGSGRSTRWKPSATAWAATPRSAPNGSLCCGRARRNGSSLSSRRPRRWSGRQRLRDGPRPGDRRAGVLSRRVPRFGPVPVPRWLRTGAGVARRLRAGAGVTPASGRCRGCRMTRLGIS